MYVIDDVLRWLADANLDSMKRQQNELAKPCVKPLGLREAPHRAGLRLAVDSRP